jgi:hypothetical protein
MSAQFVSEFTILNYKENTMWHHIKNLASENSI